MSVKPKSSILALVAVAVLLAASAAYGGAHPHEGISARGCQVCQVAKAPMLDFAPEVSLEQPVVSFWQTQGAEAQPIVAVLPTRASRAPPA
jgi:hypothetical protein